MPQRFDPKKLERELRAAERRAQAEYKRSVDAYNREVDRGNRENQRRVDAYNRKVEQHNKREINRYNRHVSQVNAHNAATIAELNRRLRAAEGGARYTVAEQALADRVQSAIPPRDEREWDVFLSYARIDGSEVGTELCRCLEELGVRTWFDAIAIVPGQSQALQMDRGLQRARAGVVLLTPAYLVGRFWTERELGALLHKDTLIPVLDRVTFDEVREYSGILPDLAGFETARDAVPAIAEKIAAAVLSA
jgi:hypothetical protein